MNNRAIIKPKILTFVGYYLPGFKGGGPIRTIENMVSHLSDDFTFLIVTSDRDLGDSNAYPDVEVDNWNNVGEASVFYASPKSRTLTAIYRLIRETQYDVLYLNSYFDPQFTLRPLLAQKLLGARARKPTIVAPRGEFSFGAYEIKRWKKDFFVRLMRLVGLFDDLTWQGSSQLEIDDIKRLSPSHIFNTVTAPDLCCAPNLTSCPARAINELNRNCAGIERRRLRVCFVSRISPKKNLDYALRVFARVKAPVYFSIYGPKESAQYWSKCEKLIHDLPDHITVEYHGPIRNSEVRSVISRYDLFFMPSHGENFGHVFLESLSAGVPILVSDQTPWRHLKKDCLGWDIPLEQPQEFVSALEKAAIINDSQRNQARINCINYARNVANDPETLRANKMLFLNAIKYFESKRSEEN